MYIKHLSASTADQWVNVCEFKVFLQKHLKLPELNKQTIHTSKGLAVHETLEDWVGKPGEQPQKDYVARLKKYYQDNKPWMLDNRKPEKGFPHPQPKKCENCPWAQKSGETFICSIANQVIDSFDGCPRPNFEDDLKLIEKRVVDPKSPLHKYKILAVEHPFTHDMGGFNIHGYIDLIVEKDKDTLNVIDYKTGNSTKNVDKAFRDFQMRIYSIVAKLDFPGYKYVEMTLDYLRKQPITVIFDKDDDDKTIEGLHKVWKRIESSKDPKIMPNFLCNYCVGLERCRSIRASFMKNGKFIMPPPVKDEDEKIDPLELI